MAKNSANASCPWPACCRRAAVSIGLDRPTRSPAFGPSQRGHAIRLVSARRPGMASCFMGDEPRTAKSMTWIGCLPRIQPCRFLSMRGSPISRTVARSSFASTIADLTPTTASSTCRGARRNYSAIGRRERRKCAVQFLARAPLNGDDSYERRLSANQRWMTYAAKSPDKNRQDPMYGRKPAQAGCRSEE